MRYLILTALTFLPFTGCSTNKLANCPADNIYWDALPPLDLTTGKSFIVCPASMRNCYSFGSLGEIENLPKKEDK